MTKRTFAKCVSALLRGRLNQFRVNRDRNLVSNGARKRGYSEVLTIDFGSSRRAEALPFAQRVFDRRRRSIHIEHHLFGHAVYGQVARNL